MTPARLLLQSNQTAPVVRLWTNAGNPRLSLRSRSFPTGFQITTALLVTVALVLAAVACAQEPEATTGWPFVGSDQAHTKYSEAEEITAANVGELEIAWTWEPNEAPLEEFGTRPGPFQTTPITVDGRLYLSTMYTRVVALDAETGVEFWTFDPKAYEGGQVGAGPTGFKHRGIAYWSDGDDERIFINSRDQLYAVDAATGGPDADFGEDGSVLLTEGHGREVTRLEFDQTSPPVVFEDLVIVGSRIPDGCNASSTRPALYRRSTSGPAKGAGCSSPSRSLATTSERTRGRTRPGESPDTPTSGG